MAQSFLTLEYNGAEKALADWGFSKPSLVLSSQASDRFTVSAAVKEAGPAAPAIPFDAWVILRDGRTVGGGGFQGGSTVFQGRRVTLPKTANPKGDALGYVFLGPWHDLEEIYFQKARNIVVNGDPSVVRTIYTSEILLFMKIVNIVGLESLSVGDQIKEILTYAIAQGARLAIGDVDPVHKVNSYQVRDMQCAPALNLCLRSCPDVAVAFDYATDPPTIHFKKRANRAPASLTIGDQTTHEETRLTGREDLRLPAVSLYFRRTNVINGFAFVEPMDQPPNWQLWPLTATGRERRTLVQTIDLEGFQKTQVFAHLDTEALKAVSDPITFWKRAHPMFSKVDGNNNLLAPIDSVSGTVVTNDDTGQVVNLAALPNQLIKGQVASWMVFGNAPSTAVTTARCTVRADIKYSEKGDDGLPQRSYKKRTFSASVMLTNAPSGDYSATQEAANAEDIPAGLARTIFESLQQLEFEGSHSFIEATASYGVTMRNTLNLTGGDPAWAAMAASVRSIKYDYEDGFTRTTVEVGPAPHLMAGELVQLFLFNRNRLFYFNAATISSGQSGQAANVSLGKEMPRENTNAGLDQISFASVNTNEDNPVGEANHIRQDAKAHAFTLATFDQGLGTPLWGQGGFELRKADCKGSDGKMYRLCAQQLTMYDVNCNTYGQIFVCSDPFPI